ncbi:thioredoxin domain-containing protein [Streptomyces luteolifulvus]|uniref:Thioredoxin domain-containing protein n=1 Tax=Streptomyces luteolifulvus TaxID=2615112 RepID=A0A6H9V9K2_9ACTN|nr:thioredoxin domain-containing protein [Streptomyces luteolifulvus]KAB1150491.1 thioredoxin domain-containing protein [Streptomyces luteolifulvus]
MVRRGRWAVLCAVAVLLVAGCGQRPADARPRFASAERLPEALGSDGTTITVGDPDAETRVQLSEDPRCPVCEEFETTGGGPRLQEAMLDHRVRTEYTLASFLDDRLGGSGSKKAVNALRAALEEGKFVEYHEVLYANQPEESFDGFTDAHLLELAAKVEGLRGRAFDAAVRSMKYRAFVTASEKAYERAGGTGTPTVVINDKRIPDKYNGLLFYGDAFAELLRKIHDEPGEWEDTTL